MPENYFGDDDAPQSSASMGDENGGEDGQDKKDGAQRQLINMEIAHGLKPGDELSLRVVAVHEKEYEVERMEGEEKQEGGEPDAGEEGGMQAPREGSMASMMG